MNVLVTGGSGFFGLHLLRGLIARGNRVRNIDKVSIDDPAIEKEVEFVRGDICDAVALEKVTTGIDVVFHNAAVVPISRSTRKGFWAINVEGTRTVMETALRCKVKKVIFISSSAPYGIPPEVPITEKTGFNPVGVYGKSKIAAEEVCGEYRRKGLDIVIIRPRTIIGTGRMGIFQILYSWIADNKNIYIIGKGDNLFQLLSASDLVQSCLLASEKPCTNEDFNIGTDVFATVREDLEALIRHAGTKTKLYSVPSGFAKTVLRILDIMNISPLVSWHYLTPDKPYYFDLTKAESLLGFKPQHSNIQMLTESYDWYLRNRAMIDKTVGTTHRKPVRQRILKLLRRIS